MSEFLRLKKSNCKNCYKCIRHCPVKSIRFSAGQANIVADECILCGRCFVVCPQNAKEIADDREKVKVLLQSPEPVYASVAPSFVANWNGSGIHSIEKALLELGFAGAEETAIGATIVKKEYERKLKEDRPEVLISSCCHSINLLIQKYFQGVLPFLADVVSPMQAHSLDIKKRHPDAKTVFIGPCVAKKDEADQYPGIVDAVLTFEEVSQMLYEQGITVSKEKDSQEESKARLFPTTGGVLKTMDCDQTDYTYIALDGVENCIAALHDIEQGGLKKCFIEMSACVGSCSGGPVMEKYHNTPIRDYAEIIGYAGKEDYQVEDLTLLEKNKNLEYMGKIGDQPSQEQIHDIFLQMGKTKPEHELNCGSCGYNTCREKAIAIYQGKAEVSMCLPYLKEKAESFSGSIINNTPNGVIVLNESLEVQQINKAALKIMNIPLASTVLGEQVIRILDPKDFIDVMTTGISIRDKRTYLAEYKKYVEQTILFDREYHTVMCLMRDVTNEEVEKEKKEAISRETAEVADRVVDKQMRIVQEIASLLGETAAETKIALAKLKESIADE
ncbi:MAG: [Fe-Fe] hydrogenase large subunit C-terminal domain-containing protein [Lachnospiraceae bacterium]